MTLFVPKASLTSHCTCMYVLVTDKNGLICKGHLIYTCNFITEYGGSRDPRNENLQANYSLHARSMVIPVNASMSQGKFRRGLDTCIFLANVVDSH